MSEAVRDCVNHCWEATDRQAAVAEYVARLIASGACNKEVGNLLSQLALERLSTLLDPL
jgi:hypothetical protein